MLQTRLTVVVLLAAFLLPTLACGGGNGDVGPTGGGGNGDGDGGQVEPVPNEAPWFQGVKSVITAGGARILVTWGPAYDDNDPPENVRLIRRVVPDVLTVTERREEHAAVSEIAAPGDGIVVLY